MPNLVYRTMQGKVSKKNCTAYHGVMTTVSDTIRKRCDEIHGENQQENSWLTMGSVNSGHGALLNGALGECVYGKIYVKCLCCDRYKWQGLRVCPLSSIHDARGSRNR